MTERRAGIIIDLLRTRKTTKPDQLEHLEELEALFSTPTRNNFSPEEHQAIRATDLMSLRWKSENSWHPSARLFIFLFYALGFVALAIPSISVFFIVVGQFLELQT